MCDERRAGLDKYLVISISFSKNAFAVLSFTLSRM